MQSKIIRGENDLAPQYVSLIMRAAEELRKGEISNARDCFSGVLHSMETIERLVKSEYEVVNSGFEEDFTVEVEGLTLPLLEE